jgi:hypothetical protein
MMAVPGKMPAMAWNWVERLIALLFGLLAGCSSLPLIPVSSSQQTAVIHGIFVAKDCHATHGLHTILSHTIG